MGQGLGKIPGIGWGIPGKNRGKSGENSWILMGGFSWRSPEMTAGFYDSELKMENLNH